MRILFLVTILLVTASVSIPQCTQDKSRFTYAKVAIANRALQQAKARLETCKQQPKPKQALCTEWADAGNKAADDIEVTAFAEIDKLAAATQ